MSDETKPRNRRVRRWSRDVADSALIDIIGSAIVGIFKFPLRVLAAIFD